jgi:CheY-like chemotaxis protein
VRELGTRDERILLVEDEEPIRDLVTTALRFTGFTVETAATGPEGLALARNHPWHVLVLDVNLPGLDGFSLCRKLREAGDEAPVIFLTARDDPADLREGFTGGGGDYLTKPFSLELILATVGGAPSALAQQAATPALAQDDLESEAGEVQERLRSGEMREELYAEFTAALADELGIGNSDEVDAAIRVAMMSVVDTRVDDGFFSVGQAEALKTLIATSDVPLGPGLMFAPPPGAFMRGGHGFGEEDRFFPVRGGVQDWIISADDESRADDGEDGAAGSDEEANEDNSQANEDDTSS